MDIVDATARSIDRSKNNLSLRPKQSGFALLLLALIILVPISGWGSTAPPSCVNQSLQIPHSIQSDATKLQCGESQITLAPLATSGSIVIVFNPSFNAIPKVRAFLEAGQPANPSSDYSLDGNVSIISKFTNTVTALNFTNTAFPISGILPSPGFLTSIPLLTNLQLQITSISASGMPTIWLQGFDCNIDQLGDGAVQAWETLGATAKTPGIATTSTGYKISTVVALNTTLISDVNGCIPPDNNFVKVRMVAQNSVAVVKTVTITKASMAMFTSTPATVVQATISAAIPSTQMTVTCLGLATVAGYNCAFFWEAQL